MEELIITAPEEIHHTNLKLVSHSTGQQGLTLMFEHMPDYGVYYQYHVGTKEWRKVTMENYVPNP